MRLTFSQDTPLHEQIKRIVKSHTGRKHQHRKGPGKLSEEQRRRREHNAKAAKARRKKFLRSARAYWRGESDEHP